MLRSKACACVLISFSWLGSALAVQPRFLSLEDRVAAQRAIEEVYWRHRIWPDSNPQPKPQLAVVMSTDAIRVNVEAYLRASSALEAEGRPITRDELQAELDRMAKSTRAPQVLRELFAALEDDAFLAAEILARPAIVERTRGALDADAPSDFAATMIELPFGSYTLPAVGGASCSPIEVSNFGLTGPAGPRTHSTAVWTGTEMIVWGGSNLSSGGRYNPATDAWTPTSEGPGCPLGRAYHTAVWTGTRMIVWGGRTGSTAEFSGGIYDPQTDTWVPTSTGEGTPIGRYIHSAVWTGSEMIVWGGRILLTSANNLLNSGGRFDPDTNTWAVTSLTGAPSPRLGTAAVWTGSHMFVWGGEGQFGAELADGGRYDPVADEWFTISPGGPGARSRHSGVWTGSRVVFWGGLFGTSSKHRDGGSYDPVSDTWVLIPVTALSPAGRSYHAAVWTGSRMVVWGGEGSGTSLLASGGSYDPATGIWLSMPTAGLAAHGSPVAVWTGSEVLIWGEGLGRYDPVLDGWTYSPGFVPEARESAATVWTGTEMIVWGGSTSTSTYSNTGGVYTPATNSWRATPTASVPIGRYGHTAVWTGTSMIVWGGLGNDSSQIRALSSGGRYDPAANTWQSTLTISDRVLYHSAVWTGSRMIVWGGEDQTGTKFPLNRSYDPDTNTWSAANLSSPIPRSRHAAVWTGKEMLIWGGTSGVATQEGSGSAYDPVTGTWKDMTTPGAPTPRSFPNAVWTGREWILWGGGSNTGARYNPMTRVWTPTSVDESTPSSRTRASAVWTGNEMVVWGGEQGTAKLEDGARYDPLTNAWTPLPSLGLIARSRHVAVWTAAELILWGGAVTGGRAADGARVCLVDCAAPTTWYQDSDGDGYGNADVTQLSCPQPVAFVADASDCSDWDAGVHHPSPEICDDGIDNDCDGLERVPAPEVCGDGIDNDCDGMTDEPEANSPPEICGDGIDNDCDGMIDEPEANSPPEICGDGIDNNCDGTVDDPVVPGDVPMLVMSRVAETTLLSWTAVPSATFYDVVLGRIGLLRASSGNFSGALLGCSRNDSRGRADSDTFAPASGDGFWYLVRAASCGGAGTYDGASPVQIGSRDGEIAQSPFACP